MIDGLKIRMTAEELTTRLTERIAWHEAAAREYAAALSNTPEGAADGDTPEHLLEHEMREHRDQAGVLAMVRDHLIPGEVYLLSELDLRFADLVPDFHMVFSPPRRRATESFEPHLEEV